MKAYLPYIIAAIVGLFLRTAISAALGYEYAINGADLVVAIAAIGLVYGVKGCISAAKSRKERRGAYEKSRNL